MQFLDLCEPGQTPEPHERESKRAIGIDLGTTNSLVAFSVGQQPYIIRDDAGNSLLASVVSYLQNGAIHVGTSGDTLPLAQATTIRSVKRLMGRGFGDIKKIAGQLPFDISMLEEDMSGIVRLAINDSTVTAVEVSAEILRTLKARAEAQLGTSVTSAVITVPAYFDDAARNATKDAATLAGLEVLRLVNEPTAAALAYGLDKQAEGIYAVYDLGGGTFDISLLRMQQGVFQVLATGGDISFGGDDIDAAIAETLLDQFEIKHHPAELTTAELHELLSTARRIKEALSDETSCQFECHIQGIPFSSNFSRDMLERLIAPSVQHTLSIAATVLDDAGLTVAEIKGVVMVGGSTRIPAIRHAIGTFFGTTPLTDVNPDEVVALGAALQAENLTVGSGNLLLDVTPLSLGLEIMGGMNEKIIHRNTPIPVAVAQEFTSYQDGQTGMQIHVVQGEREMVADCRPLAHFELKGIPPMPAGAARVKVTFTVDADGLLTVSAREETTGTTQEVAVKPSYGLREGEIEAMLRQSMEHARSDVQRRLLAETTIEAQQNIIAVEQALTQDSTLLTEEELSRIESQLATLKQAVSTTDRERILHETGQLEAVTNTLVTKRMNAHISKSFTGMTLEQLEKIAENSDKKHIA
jgi:molecular chaperone HscA